MIQNFILAQSSAAGSGMSSILMIVALIAIFYFFMILPQQKRNKKIAQFRDSLQKGDKVITSGGIYGRISEIKKDDPVVMLEIAKGVTIRIDKNCIYQSVQEVNESGAQASTNTTAN